MTRGGKRKKERKTVEAKKKYKQSEDGDWIEREF